MYVRPSSVWDHCDWRRSVPWNAWMPLKHIKQNKRITMLTNLAHLQVWKQSKTKSVQCVILFSNPNQSKLISAYHLFRHNINTLLLPWFRAFTGITHSWQHSFLTLHRPKKWWNHRRSSCILSAHTNDGRVLSEMRATLSLDDRGRLWLCPNVNTICVHVSLLRSDD